MPKAHYLTTNFRPLIQDNLQLLLWLEKIVVLQCIHCLGTTYVSWTF